MSMNFFSLPNAQLLLVYATTSRTASYSYFAECADPETAWKAQQDKIDALVEALEKAQQRIAELESRAVKLPNPHAHLIWIQAGHAPDDYWDDVAVSHSEKDRCCDGSERYPVYARWEIEGMLTAAGINW